MKKSLFIILITVATFAAIGFVSCNKKVKETTSNNTQEVIPVKIALAQKITTTDNIQASGFISSASEARLSFKTGGIIKNILVKEGEHVKKGQVLATLNLTEIAALTEQAKQAYEKAERDFKRAENLYKDSVATLEQMQNATTGLKIAKEQYDVALFNKSYSEIKAPEDGRIIKKLMNEGEIISPGMPVFFMNIAGKNDWLIKAGIADKDWAKLKIGDKATAVIDAYSETVFNAEVSQLAQAPDPLSGLYAVELKIQSNNMPLATGLFTKVSIKPSQHATYVSIPVDAVIEGNGNEAFVYTLQGSTAVKKPVKIGFISNGKVMLHSGIDHNTQVITDGSAYLKNGTSVKAEQ